MTQVRKTAKGKPYRKPRLRQYGDLRRLTETDITGAASLDGGMYGQVNTKTSG